MRNIWIVSKQEITATLSQASFWVMTFLFPAFMIGINLLTQLPLQNTAQANTNQIEANTALGYVDPAGLVQTLPPELPAELLRKYPDQPSAQAALERGEIEQYVDLSEVNLPDRNLVVVQRTFNPLADTPEDLFHYLLVYNQVGDQGLAARITAPGAGQVEHTLAAPAVDQSSSLLRLAPYATLLIFFFLFTTSSGLMLRSVSREKTNRTAEVLLLSLPPRELMAGKLLGLSAVAFLQMAVWVGGGVLLVQRELGSAVAQSVLGMPAAFLAWAVLYFLLGYCLYAALMGAVGALVPSFREAGQFTFFIMVPLIAPILFNPVFTKTPNGPLPVALSIFPLTAPTAMMSRLAATLVPAWQLVVSLALLAGTTFIVVQMAARAFSTDTLLSDSALKWDRLVRVLRRGESA